MASIRFGNGVADARGSINGTTFSRNANGGYARNRTTPTNPRTGRQVAQRLLLSGLSSQWRSLDNGERQTWIDGAPNFPYTNRLGERSTLTGPQLYTKLNLALLSAGQPTISRCPAPEVFPFLGDAVLVLDSNAGVLDFAVNYDNDIPVGFTAQVFASVGVSAGRNATSTPKKLVATVAGAGAPSVAFGAGYSSVYGPPVGGTNIVVEVRLVNNSTGQTVTTFTGSGLVVEV